MQSITFNGWVWRWLKVKERRVKKSSMATYLAYVRLYLAPTFGHLPLEEIQVPLIEHAVNAWRARGLAPATVRAVLNLLESCLVSAAGRYRTGSLDFSEIYLGHPAPRRIKTLTLTEQERLIQHICSATTPKALAIGLALGCGLRIGEVCGAQWVDVDKTRQVVTVKRTVQRIQCMKNTELCTKKSRGATLDEPPNEPSNEPSNEPLNEPPVKPSQQSPELPLSQVVISTPKTPASFREVPIPNWLFVALMKSRANADTQEGTRANTSAYIASNAAKPTEPRALRSWYVRCARRIGLNPEVTFHGLRHSYATRCIQSGIDAKAVSVLLGHSSVRTTLDIYMHPPADYLLQSINRAFDTETDHFST